MTKQTQTAAAAAYAPGVKVHKFELAGLGLAPYVFDGCEYKTFQAATGTPMQVGGSCDYCGTGICFMFWLRSADGKRFKVGSDCILKTTGDRSLVIAVKTEVQKHEAALREARRIKGIQRDQARVDAAIALLPTLEDTLKSEPHPGAASNSYFSDKTRLDWVRWMLQNAGLAGKVTVAKFLEGKAA